MNDHDIQALPVEAARPRLLDLARETIRQFCARLIDLEKLFTAKDAKDAKENKGTSLVTYLH